MLKFLSSLSVAIGLTWGLSAKEVMVGEQFAPPLPITEIATNVAFNIQRSDVKAFDVCIDLVSSVSNCVQVAFGRDADGDGNLTPEETDLVLGWRAERYFVENVKACKRYDEPQVENGGGFRHLRMWVDTDSSFLPKEAAFESESGACFEAIAAASPSWLFSPNWNLLKVTRRGLAPAGETCRIRSAYGYLSVILR